MFELVEIDHPRHAIATTAGILGAITSSPQWSLFVAAVVSALASVLVDVIRAAGRYAVKRLAPDLAPSTPPPALDAERPTQTPPEPKP